MKNKLELDKEHAQAIGDYFKNREEYFTPDIEDIRVGYECEINVNGRWLIHVFGGIDTFRADDWYNLHRMHDATKTIENYIRVPYLSKEQIEAEGWKKDKNSSYGYYRKGDRWLDFVEGVHDIEIFTVDSPYDDSCIYSGECKDINTFRYICKLLNIQ